MPYPVDAQHEDLFTRNTGNVSVQYTVTPKVHTKTFRLDVEDHWRIFRAKCPDSEAALPEFLRLYTAFLIGNREKRVAAFGTLDIRWRTETQLEFSQHFVLAKHNLRPVLEWLRHHTLELPNPESLGGILINRDSEGKLRLVVTFRYEV